MRKIKPIWEVFPNSPYKCKTTSAVLHDTGWLTYSLKDGTQGLAKPGNFRLVNAELFPELLNKIKK